LEWCAPEVYSKDKIITPKIDSYSYGICLWELFSGEIPYLSLKLDPIALAIEIYTGNRPPTLQLEPKLSAFLQSLWMQDHNMRPDFATIIQTLPTITSIPFYLICPLTKSIFREPVIAEDEITYEREAIIKWLKENGTSPTKNVPLTEAGLRYNKVVADIIKNMYSK